MNCSGCSQLLTHEEIIKNQIKVTKIKKIVCTVDWTQLALVEHDDSLTPHVAETFLF
jgi:hypothetical protein